MFRIKICGVTSAKDAQLVGLAGADAVGLNFYSQSPRFLDPSKADSVALAVPARVQRVGVFVNSTVEEVLRLADRCRLDWIQLHGDEPAEFLGGLPGRTILRSFPYAPDLPSRVRDYWQGCEQHGTKPQAILIDAAKADGYGGTGATLDWEGLAAVRHELPAVPLVLAGGLTPFNVVEAIARVRPDAVDVASGVESKPGTKDMLLLRAFVMSAKKALAYVPS